VQKEECSTTYAKCTLGERRGIFIRDKPTFSSERMLLEDYYRIGSVEKKKTLVLSLMELDAKTN
jgi:hypothetical protein